MEKWKDRVIDKLRDYDLQKAAIDGIPFEIKRLEIESVSIRSASADGAPVRGGGNGREERMLWNIMQRDDMRRNLDMATQYVAHVERGLAVLDQDEIRVLDRMYIHPERNAVERLRDEWGMVERHSVYRRLDKILYKLAVAMYGVITS